MLHFGYELIAIVSPEAECVSAGGRCGILAASAGICLRGTKPPSERLLSLLSPPHGAPNRADLRAGNVIDGTISRSAAAPQRQTGLQPLFQPCRAQGSGLWAQEQRGVCICLFCGVSKTAFRSLLLGHGSFRVQSPRKAGVRMPREYRVPSPSPRRATGTCGQRVGPFKDSSA